MKRHYIITFLIIATIIFLGCNNLVNLQNDVSEEITKTDIHNSVSDSTVEIHGTDKDDIIKRTTNEDTVIYCGGGNDYVYGGEGYDWVHGEDGNDEIYGNGGNDYLGGGPGNDKIYAGDSTDKPSAKVCNVLLGDEGNDRLYDGAGRDDIYPGPGDDKIYLTSGTNWVIFNPGDGMNNRVYLKNGDDTIVFNVFLPDLTERKTRVYLESDDKISGKKTIYLWHDTNINYTLNGAYYDKDNSTNYYVKVNGEVIFVITIKKYTSDPNTHWIEFIKE